VVVDGMLEFPRVRIVGLLRGIPTGMVCPTVSFWSNPFPISHGLVDHGLLLEAKHLLVRLVG